MKLLLSLLSIITFFNVSFATNSFINFIPSNNNKCKINSVGGLGYSLSIDTCISLDQTYSHIITDDSGDLSWSVYHNENGTLCSGTPLSVTSLDTSSCQKYPIQFDSDLDLYQDSYYKLSVTSTPIILPNSYVLQYTSDVCNTDNISIVEYLTSGLQAGSAEDVVTYFCKNGKAYSQECIESDCSPATLDSSNCQALSYTITNSTEVDYSSIYCTQN